MSNVPRNQIMDQVMSITDRLAGNPNSKLDANNLFDFITKLTDTVSAGYQKVAALEASTSLTAAETPAVKTAVEPAAITTAEAVQAEAPVVAETAPVAATAPAASAPATQPTKSAAKKTASATIKSAPAVPAPTAAAPAAKAPATAKTPAAAKAAAPKAEAKSTAKATKKAPAPAPAPEAPMTAEEKDQATADSMIAEHGSARAAAAYVEKNRTRGRKTAWQKIIEERADQELRGAARNHKKINAQGLAAAIAAKPEGVSDAEAKKTYSLETTGYAFAHIDRKPVMDPEKALGAKITCLIDGVEKTMMSRYLDAAYAMSPEEYIAHFDLRPDYPMTADGYKGEKRRLAAVQGLGKGKRTTDQAEAAPAPVAAETPATVSNRRSRKRAA